jgi:plastocyanin
MVGPRRFAVPLIVAGILVPIGLAGCGGSYSSSDGGSNSSRDVTTTVAAASTAEATTTSVATTTAAAGASSATVNLVADPNGLMAFDTTTLTAKAGTVTISLNNPSSTGMPHGIAVQGNGVDKDGPTVQPGGTSTVTVTLKPGTYTYYCPVAGHEAAGMKGTLTVTA